MKKRRWPAVFSSRCSPIPSPSIEGLFFCPGVRR
ncbi:pyrBI operon leader peptide [Escherichia sp. E2593]